MMITSYRRFIQLGVAVFGLTFAGCSESPPPPSAGELEKLSPAMEDMKANMLKQMKNKEFGRDLTKLPKAH